MVGKILWDMPVLLFFLFSSQLIEKDYSYNAFFFIMEGILVN